MITIKLKTKDEDNQLLVMTKKTRTIRYCLKTKDEDDPDVIKDQRIHSHDNDFYCGLTRDTTTGTFATDDTDNDGSLCN